VGPKIFCRFCRTTDNISFIIGFVFKIGITGDRRIDERELAQVCRFVVDYAHWCMLRGSAEWAPLWDWRSANGQFEDRATPFTLHDDFREVLWES